VLAVVASMASDLDLSGDYVSGLLNHLREKLAYVEVDLNSMQLITGESAWKGTNNNMGKYTSKVRLYGRNETTVVNESSR
jgi:hypothetical protein